MYEIVDLILKYCLLHHGSSNLIQRFLQSVTLWRRGWASVDYIPFRKPDEPHFARRFAFIALHCQDLYLTFIYDAEKDGNKHLLINADRVKYWLALGAQPSPSVARILGQIGVLPPLPYRSITPKDVRKPEKWRSTATTKWLLQLEFQLCFKFQKVCVHASNAGRRISCKNLVMGNKLCSNSRIEVQAEVQSFLAIRMLLIRSLRKVVLQTECCSHRDHRL